MKFNFTLYPNVTSRGHCHDMKVEGKVKPWFEKQSEFIGNDSMCGKLYFIGNNIG